ncbi:ornithine cyclodeaminase family protein [Marinomonas sp. 2405UD68-3]|uniref:ornithine cyclodeaminase family protein n=1 Tax=Marinomonas sp. 2405UD68-3 TaxID=3391835 RepID=UPI0039C9DFDD
MIEQTQPMQILFKDSQDEFIGDCHVKAAQKRAHPYFVIKVAAGFYQSVANGLPANSGLMLVMSAKTGYPIALLQDEGWLTQIRTAAAGALAASLKPVKQTDCLGVIGTGDQAYLQVKLISNILGLQRVAVLGRSFEKSKAFCDTLAEELNVLATPMDTVKGVCHASQILITATPSTTALVTADDLPESLHIVAIGADSPGKSEIAPSVFAKASIVITDNHEQCLHHGDFGAAVTAQAIEENGAIAFGDVLAGKYPNMNFQQAGISVVDLTGIGAQDLAVASLVVDCLEIEG